MVSIESITRTVAPIIFPFVDVDCVSKVTSVANLAADLFDPLLALLGFYRSLGIYKTMVTWKVLAAVNPNKIKSLTNMNRPRVKDIGKVMF